MTPRVLNSGRMPGAFTMMELLVAMSVLSLMVVMLAGMLHQTSVACTRSTGKIEQFREARLAFESMTSRLSQATLNTYWDFDNASAPTRFQRNSELRFISGPAEQLLGASPAGWTRPTHAVFFQAPFGVTDAATTPQGFENLLSTWGYYLEYRDDLAERPAFVTPQIMPPRYRCRLMELWQPAKQNAIYEFTSGFDGQGIARSRSYAGRQWFQDSVDGTNAPVRQLAENVVALIITPRLARADEEEIPSATVNNDFSPLAPDYLYDSSPLPAGSGDSRYKDGRLNPTHQLPPMLQVTMVTVDETSIARMNLGAGTPDVFGVNNRFKKTGDYSSDLLQTGDQNSLENQLIARKANYRIFSTRVLLRGARWSREQTN